MFPWHTLVPFLGRPHLVPPAYNNHLPSSVPLNGSVPRVNQETVKFPPAPHHPVYHNMEPAKSYAHSSVSPQYPIASNSHSKPSLHQRAPNHSYASPMPDAMLPSQHSSHTRASMGSHSFPQSHPPSAVSATTSAVSRLKTATKSASVSAPPGRDGYRSGGGVD